MVWYWVVLAVKYSKGVPILKSRLANVKHLPLASHTRFGTSSAKSLLGNTWYNNIDKRLTSLQILHKVTYDSYVCFLRGQHEN